MSKDIFEYFLDLSERKDFLSTIYKIYKDMEKRFDPEIVELDEVLQKVGEYYNEFIQMWEEGRGEGEPGYTKRAYKKRYMEIQKGLSSNNITDKIIALDNAINQWHVDQPALNHFAYRRRDKSFKSFMKATELVGNIKAILSRLGRVPKE